MPFKNNTKTEKIDGLHLNRLINGRVNCEKLDDLNLMQKAQYNGQKGCVNKLLMNSKVKGASIFNRAEQGIGHHSKNAFAYHKPNMRTEVHEWIKTVYRNIFKVDSKKDYCATVKTLNKEEEEHNAQANSYVVGKIKEIQIDNIEEMSDNRSCSEVAKGAQCGHRQYGQVDQTQLADSDDETIKTDNKSWRSQSSLDSISQDSKQTKIIMEMQEEINQMREEQRFLRNHIIDLESTVIALGEDETNAESYNSTKSKDKKLKRKRDKYDCKMKEQKQDKMPKSILCPSKKIETETGNGAVKEKINKIVKGKGTSADQVDYENKMEVDQKQHD